MIFKKWFAKVLDNILHSNRSECLDLMGSEKELADMAMVWEHNASGISKIGAYLILEFSSKGDYTKEEMTAYRQAIKDFANMIQRCNNEYVNRDLALKVDSL